jgi:hypothetical protein
MELELIEKNDKINKLRDDNSILKEQLAMEKEKNLPLQIQTLLICDCRKCRFRY